ncbi:MAG: hypothetical protein HOC34_02375 [Candidatus Magasanikbacteria bacterium]|jgi:hypothetical protein|nr:hypothetical protein [Candidatus Magasanikbacteria bacterium]MBT4220857.1 hypothetical protein [Candidatus Magasanikbacteria bacterium]MBT4350870.1 hypothetical protein [Candidatus Magasanikbacteria bacterium]MBT4541788.1 hypothetical protein [Candidatus Magasanikbacteria bacterium]MBT6253548.1 hypothetical protein [Candidatus Magasanikbacteria bacterium]
MFESIKNAGRRTVEKITDKVEGASAQGFLDKTHEKSTRVIDAIDNIIPDDFLG